VDVPQDAKCHPLFGRYAKGGCGSPIALEPVDFDVVVTVVARMEGRRATLVAVRPAGNDAVAACHEANTRMLVTAGDAPQRLSHASGLTLCKVEACSARGVRWLWLHRRHESR
jgi:hypothetical protein